MADIDIARQANMQRIVAIAKDRLDIDEQFIEPFGHYKGEVVLGLHQRSA